MKWLSPFGEEGVANVALFMRAWIEIYSGAKFVKICFVALFMSAWIEI